MDIYILDKDFNLISTGMPYENLQWNRRYYEAGTFSVQISSKLYDSSWAYIGTPERTELGEILKREFYGEGDTSVLLSGYFCEKRLDEKACYPRYVGDVQKTETAVRNIFTKYKGDLPIYLGEPNDPLLGDRTQSDFSDEPLGQKLFSILESREMSYRVRYDYVNNRLMFEVWQGLDRTQSQSVNPHWTFSSEFGNLTDKKFDEDESAYKNYAIIPADADDNNVERKTFYLDMRKDPNERKREKVIDMRSSHPEDGQSAADFENACKQEALEKMVGYAKIQEMTIEIAGAEGYMEDWDLGDKCDVILTDATIQAESRISGVNEVFKAGGGHTVGVDLGNKRIDNIRRAVNSL